MIEIHELGKKSWNKGYAYSLTYDESYNETRLQTEITQTTDMYSLVQKVRRTSDLVAAESIAEKLYEDEFLRKEYFSDCILVPVPGQTARNAIYVIAEEMKRKFDASVELDGAFGAVYSDETVELEKHKTRTRKHPAEYIVSKDFKEKIQPDTRIVILDDIYDEGSTVEAAASALVSAGVTNVDVFVLCMTHEAFIRTKIVKSNEV